MTYRQSNPRRASRRQPNTAGAVEILESRLLMAVVSVTDLGDTGPGTLRAAVASANSGDTIDLSQVTGSISLASQLTVDKSLLFKGPGAALLTIDGNNATRPFFINSGETVEIDDLTIANGGLNGGIGGGIYGSGATLTLDRVAMTNNLAAEKGGAIYWVGGALTLTDSSFSNNAVNGTTFAAGGGVMGENTTLVISGCTFDGNAALTTGPTDEFDPEASVFGGGLCIMGSSSATVTNSTFTGNTAHEAAAAQNSNAFGGGVLVSAQGDFTMTNCTLAGNTSVGDGASQGWGGGLHVYSLGGTGKVTNTIVANNTAANGPDVYNGLDISGGNNLIGDGIYSGFSDGVNNDHVGSEAALLDPKLSPLADNGGATKTMALLAGSPAINAGTDTGAPATDQRGQARSGATDIGAFEFVATNHAPTFTSTAPTSASAGTPFTYSITTHDEDGDSVTITAPTLPAWLIFTDNGDGTATLTGTPTNADTTGNNDVVLRVGDGTDLTEQSFTLAVAKQNNAPQFDSAAPVGPVVVGTPFVYLVEASDIDGDPVAITAPALPSWLTLHDNGDGTAVLSGTPTAADGGLNPIVLRVTDDSSVSTDQTAPLIVAAPRFTLDNGTLTVAGGLDPDTIQVWVRGNTVRAVRNGVIKNYPLSSVKQVEMYGFDGNDNLSVNTRAIPAYALGGAGNDTLMGGDEEDNIVGGGGKDLLTSAGGNDRLDGGNGNDTLLGGDGDDRVFGGDGNDVLVGGNGLDQLRGEDGDDALFGRDGGYADFVAGGAGHNTAQIDASDTTDGLLELLA